MRVAIVGANFLGSATAFYARQALNANRDGDPNSQEEDDEVVVFDQLPRTGGHKFNVLTLNDVAVPAGTASALDISTAPLFQTLLRDASIPQPSRARSFQWTIFDWDSTSHCLSKHRSSFLSAISSINLLLILLHLLLFASVWFLYPLLSTKGIRAFTYYYRDEDGLRLLGLRYDYIILFAFTAFLGGGIIPLNWLFRLYNHIFHHVSVRITSSITYGSPTISNMYMLATQFKEHLELIDKHNSCTSCITLAHLLSACGLGKYAKKSTLEHFGSFQLFPTFLTECISPSMSFAYGDSSVGANSESNALATILSILTMAPIPGSLRANPAYFNSKETEQLCPSLIEAAKAKVELNMRVVSVSMNGDKYNVHAIELNGNGAKREFVDFDAVLVAAVIDPDEFKSDALDASPELLFSLDGKYQFRAEPQMRLNTSKYVSLVQGDLKSSFFGLRSPKDMLDRTYVLNSVNCTQIERVKDDVWMVTGTEKAASGSSLVRTMFSDVKDFVVCERQTRRYHISPLSKVNGNSVPNVVLARKFINVAAIDRVCSDVNMECAAARNAASLLRIGVAQWK